MDTSLTYTNDILNVSWVIPYHLYNFSPSSTCIKHINFDYYGGKHRTKYLVWTTVSWANMPFLWNSIIYPVSTIRSPYPIKLLRSHILVSYLIIRKASYIQIQVVPMLHYLGGRASRRRDQMKYLPILHQSANNCAYISQSTWRSPLLSETT